MPSPTRRPRSDRLDERNPAPKTEQEAAARAECGPLIETGLLSKSPWSALPKTSWRPSWLSGLLLPQRGKPMGPPSHIFKRGPGRPSPYSRCHDCGRRESDPVHRQDPGERLLKLKEVRSRLGISRSQLYRLREEGQLHFVYLGPRSPRVREAELDGLIRDLAVNMKTAPLGAPTPREA